MRLVAIALILVVGLVPEDTDKWIVVLCVAWAADAVWAVIAASN